MVRDFPEHTGRESGFRSTGLLVLHPAQDEAQVREVVPRLNAQGIVASPVKSFGLLSAAVVALSQAERGRERERYVAKLEQRLAGLRKIAKAKSILMQSRSIGEEEAYRLIREQSMAKRVTTEEIADAIINANEILAFEGKGP